MCSRRWSSTDSVRLNARRHSSRLSPSVTNSTGRQSYQRSTSHVDKTRPFSFKNTQKWPRSTANYSRIKTGLCAQSPCMEKQWTNQSFGCMITGGNNIFLQSQSASHEQTDVNRYVCDRCSCAGCCMSTYRHYNSTGIKQTESSSRQQAEGMKRNENVIIRLLKWNYCSSTFESNHDTVFLLQISALHINVSR